jgi:SAM-dependent methyltransferase
MLAPANYPLRYHWFNLKWGAPSGRLIRGVLSRERRTAPWRARLVGCFGFQGNNSTRAFEYPWAFEAIGPSAGLRVLEIGGSLSGFQFALDRAGCEVVNVDPGDPFYTGLWPATPANVALLNGLFKTNVTLKQCFLADAAFPDASFDRVVSISVFEHIPEEALTGILRETFRILKPGGLLILSIDLFLNVQPFEDRVANEYGHNVSVKWLVEKSGMEIVHGKPAELFGYPDFNWKVISANRNRYLTGNYPSMVQTVVLRKPNEAGRPPRTRCAS